VNSPINKSGETIMKRSIRQLIAVVAVAAGVSFRLQAAETSPGELDFGKLGEPNNGSRFVEVNIGRNLISLAARFVDKPQPEVAKLLRSVQRVRVNVVGLTDENKEGTSKRIADIRSKLDKEGWERIVTVQEQKGEDVGVYVKARGDEALEGVVVTVMNEQSKEAVFVNVVGDIKPEQIAALGEALDIDPLKKIGAAAKQ
jgi:virulence-associated protein VapD